VLERNVTIGRGELDIVAEKDDTLVFIEVKSGRERPDYTPADHVHASKRKQLTKLGNEYINQRKYAWSYTKQRYSGATENPR